VEQQGRGSYGVGRLGWEPIQFVDFDCIFAPDLSRWRAIVMAKKLVLAVGRGLEGA
jgi:hypothetical protein